VIRRLGRCPVCGPDPRADYGTSDFPPPGMTALSPGRFGPLPDDALLTCGLWQYAHYYDPITAVPEDAAQSAGRA
jgi:hypothetical protein